MNTYRVTLTLRSALGTPLTADTLFGHLCWGIASREGAEVLTAFLAAMESDEPPLVISDPLPAGFWPMPSLPVPEPATHERLLKQAGGTDSPAAHDRIRSLLRRPWLPHELWSQIADRLDAGTIAQALLDKQWPEPAALREEIMPHNTVNRLTTHTSTYYEDGTSAGGLFFDEQMFPPGGQAEYDVWVRSVDPPQRVREIFEIGLAGGYGRDAGTGKGHLTVDRVESVSLPQVDQANAVMTLGTCAPAADDPADGVWTIDVRHGKLGGAWAASAGDDGVFKRPVVLLARGAVFRSDRARPVIGRMVRDVHPTRPEVVACGRTLILPVRLTEEAIPCPAIA